MNRDEKTVLLFVAFVSVMVGLPVLNVSGPLKLTDLWWVCHDALQLFCEDGWRFVQTPVFPQLANPLGEIAELEIFAFIGICYYWNIWRATKDEDTRIN